MGKKGDERVKGPQAQRLYADGHTLDEIAGILDTSTTSLTRWKDKSGVPGEDLDGWDLARQNNRRLLDRLRALLEREVEYAEQCKPGSINPASVDAMSKFGAIVHKMEAEERKEQERTRLLNLENNKAAEFDRPKFFIENLKWIVEQLKTMNPAALSVIADDIPKLTALYKKQNG